MFSKNCVLSVIVGLSMTATAALASPDKNRSSRAEIGQNYLDSKYGSGAMDINTLLDNTETYSVKKKGINVGDPPADHPSHRAAQYTRDRK